MLFTVQNPYVTGLVCTSTVHCVRVLYTVYGIKGPWTPDLSGEFPAVLVQPPENTEDTAADKDSWSMYYSVNKITAEL